MGRPSVQVKMPDNVDLSDLKGSYDEIYKNLAERVKVEAKNSTAFEDETGALRKSIRVRKSRFQDGGYIVFSKVPYAHLVEYGHALVRNKKVVGHVPAHPFLRPALEKVMASARDLFR